MTLNQFLVLFSVAAFLGIVAGLLDTFKEARIVAKMGGRDFVKDKRDFLSIWQIAHQWEGLDPVLPSIDEMPLEIKRRVNQVLLGFFGKELSLRKPSGYRVVGHSWVHALLFQDREYNKLWEALTTGNLDAQLLDSFYVRRGEILRWCDKEYVEPPSCWAPPSTTPEPVQIVDDGDEDMRWYKDMSDLRRRKTACLELAKHIWKQEGPIGYEAVRTHSLMKQAGLPSVFSPGGFKKAARDYAPVKVKIGGRPKEIAT